MGHVDVAFQTYTFLFSFALGVGLCIVYDIFKALHLTKFKSAVAVFVTDIIFWLFAALCTYCFLLLMVKGQVRFFVLFGIALGFCVFKWTLSRFTVLLFSNIIKGIDAISRAISKFADLILLTINKYLKKTQNSFKKHLQPKLKLLYNQIKVSVLRQAKENQDGCGN